MVNSCEIKVTDEKGKRSSCKIDKKLFSLIKENRDSLIYSQESFIRYLIKLGKKAWSNEQRSMCHETSSRYSRYLCSKYGFVDSFVNKRYVGNEKVNNAHLVLKGYAYNFNAPKSFRVNNVEYLLAIGLEEHLSN